MTLSRFRITAMLLLAMLLPAQAGVAAATTRAWIDRDTVAVGDTVTLNIETDQATATPEYAPLQADFALGMPSSSRQIQMTNGATRVKSLFGIALTPRRAGELTIPSLQVGAQRTAPLSLTVTPGNAAAPAVRGDESVFIETEVDDANPYVQQSVGMRVRLYYNNLLSGQLEMDTPEGVSLQTVGDDVRSSRDVNGRRYSVIERHFLLIPERSGELGVPVARFQGRGVGGGMSGGFFGRVSEEVRASSPPRKLNVRAQPDNAPEPWLPLRGLRLRYSTVPQSAHAGEAVTIAVEAVAEGGTRAQFADLPLPTVAGARVFAEPVQYDEAFVDGSMQLTMTRSYSLVPDQPGRLMVPGIKLGWWDVRNGRPQTTALHDLELQVLPGTGAAPAPVAPVPLMGADDTHAAAPAVAVAVVQPAPSPSIWLWLAIVFAVLWLSTLAWMLWRRGPLKKPAVISTSSTGQEGGSAPHSLADLKRVLNNGDLDEVADTLRAMAVPAAADVDELIVRLADPAQRQAVEGLRRARWHRGDPGAARRALREAFRDGPRWQVVVEVPVEPLPPLYPRH